MKLLANQSSEASLAECGAEVVRLLKGSDFHALAERFGYALAFDRPKAEAIQADLSACLLQGGSNATVSTAAQPEIVVKFFKPNSANLFAAVECTNPLAAGSGSAFVELIVTSVGENKHICLEQISYAA